MCESRVGRGFSVTAKLKVASDRRETLCVSFPGGLDYRSV